MISMHRLIGCRNVANPAKTVPSPNMNFMDTKDQAHARFVNEFLSDHGKIDYLSYRVYLEVFNGIYNL